MWQRLLRWLLPLAASGFLLLPEARAQSKAAVPQDTGGHTGAVVVSYVLAVVGTLVVVAILCTPSRKRSRD